MLNVRTTCRTIILFCILSLAFNTPLSAQTYESYIEQGLAAAQEQRYDEAIERFRQALKTAPDDIRNALTYDLGRLLGMKFCPAAKFADLYLNGQYRGTYQISDQVQVHKKRVDIDEENGWFLEVVNENSREEPLITTTRYGIMYNIKNPEGEFLTVGKRVAIGQLKLAGLKVGEYRSLTHDEVSLLKRQSGNY